MQTQLDKQYDLMHLIVQKMDIVSEADQFDEGEEMESTLQTSSPTRGGFSESRRGLARDDSTWNRRGDIPTMRVKSYLNTTK